jgi:hypothetical protein
MRWFRGMLPRSLVTLATEGAEWWNRDARMAEPVAPIPFCQPATQKKRNTLSLFLSKYFISSFHFIGPGQLSRYSESLRAGRSGDRIPVAVRFSAPVQTGPGAHPTPYTMGTGSFPAVKRPESGADHPPPSSAEVKERV